MLFRSRFGCSRNFKWRWTSSEEGNTNSFTLKQQSSESLVEDLLSHCKGEVSPSRIPKRCNSRMMQSWRLESLSIAYDIVTKADSDSRTAISRPYLRIFAYATFFSARMSLPWRGDFSVELSILTRDFNADSFNSILWRFQLAHNEAH